MNNNISYSTIIENYPKSNQLFYKKNVRLLEQRQLYHWVDGTDIKNCYICGKKFSLFYRRHHCRLCGRIFCYDCCSNFVSNDLLDSSLPKPDKSWFSNFFDEKTSRLCLNCFQKHKITQKNKKLQEIFNIIKLNIKDYFTIACVCTRWNNIAIQYFSKFRNIQYKLIGDKFTSEEKKIIWNNKQFFKGHSKYIIQLIRITNWDIIIKKKYEQILQIINSKKRNVSCWCLMCSRTCSIKFTTFDAFISLFLNKYPYYIEKYLIECLDKSFNSEFKSYIPNIVYLLRNEISSSKSQIFKLLLKRSSNSIYIANSIYWEIITQSHELQYKNIYIKYSNLLLQHLKKNGTNIQKSINLTNILSDIFKSKITYENICVLNEKLKQSKYTPSPLITNAKFYAHKIKFKNIIIKNSYSKPIIIPTIVKINSKNYIYKMMYKKDDLRIESIVMNIINLIDIILIKNNINLYITKYNIVPINYTEGFIEIIPNSFTLHNIKKNNFSIQNYIIENSNNKDSIKDIRMKFVSSCAGCCIISYILGLGDRHLENIMITQNGTLFHIDYAYILGYDPKFNLPEIRITPDMVDALGGLNSSYYIQFQNICTKAYNILRRYSDLFMINLSLLYKLKIDNKFSEKYIKEQILKRLIPNENYRDANLNFKMKVAKSQTSYYSYRLVDLFHRTKQDTIFYESENKSLSEIINPYEISKIFKNKKNTKFIKNSIKNSNTDSDILYEVSNTASLTNSLLYYFS